MTTLLITKREKIPVTEEMIDKMRESGHTTAGMEAIIEKYGFWWGNHRCFSVSAYEPNLIKTLLLHSGYLPYICGKYWGTGFYSISNSGKPIWVKERITRKFAPESFGLGKVDVSEADIESVEAKLCVLRGIPLNKPFEGVGCHPEHCRYPKIRLNGGDLLLKSSELRWGDMRIIHKIKEQNPNNWEGLETSIKSDILLTLKLQEYNFLSSVQKERINVW